MAKIEDSCYSVYGNKLSKRDSKKVQKWGRKFKKMFDYDETQTYSLSLKDNPYLGDMFGLKDIVLGSDGEAIDREKGLVISTIRMGFGHYRIAMAGMSAAKAMGFTPYWMDLLALPGISTDIINWCNTNYSKFSRLSQRSPMFNKYVWESVTTGEKSTALVQLFLDNMTAAWPWRHIKTNAKDYEMSSLMGNLFSALPQDMPVLTSHMWNCMAAISGGLTNVVDMMFDNWPMSFQLTEGAKHAVQSPSGYYGFRAMNNFADEGQILKPMPPEELRYVGHHVDHELVLNIEKDCELRVQRMKNGEPRRFLVTMGGAGAQRELFKAIIDHVVPLVKKEKAALFVNLGDHKMNWDWLKDELKPYEDILHTHFDFEEAKNLVDDIREKPVKGLHVFLFDNTYHAVYYTNYLMRVIDVMITKPSELAFYPVPKLFNERVGGHEMWGAIRGAEIGDSTIECRTIPQTLQAIDLLTHSDDLLEMYCDCIVKNKSIGIYDGAYKCVEWATGKAFDPEIRNRKL